MGDGYCVYEHIFPNGKKYIGITSDAQKRWRNGNGYETQGKIAKAISKYGWENVTHNIIVDGLSKEQAEQLEKYLIAELHTIDNGYNTSIGGENIVTYYLDDYVLSMIQYAEKYYDRNQLCPIEFTDGTEVGIPEFVSEGKTDKGRADWANEASQAVTRKHRIYSTTDEDDVVAYWFYMREYFFLSLMIEQGKDVSNWVENHCTRERLSAEQIERLTKNCEVKGIYR